MATKSKSKDSAEGMVKIVGLNHGLCLQTFLSKDGWKEEKFVDVVFLCMQPHSMDETTTPKALQKKLKANKSVLAAASPFFAQILPDYHQDEDFIITVEYTYEELFPVLEYVYSGRLVCSEEEREQILSIISELKISTTQTEVQKHSEIPSKDDCFTVQPVVASYGKDNVNKSHSSRNAAAVVLDHREDNQIKSQNPRIIAEAEPKTISVKETNTIHDNARPPKSSELPAMDLKKYPSKKNVQKTMLLAINKQFNAKLSLRTGKITSKDSQANDFTFSAPMDPQTTTYDAFDEDMGLYTSAELLNDTQIITESSRCNLLDYANVTWDCGVYSPVTMIELAMQQSFNSTKRNSEQRKTPRNSTTSSTRSTHSHIHIASESQNNSNSVRVSANNEVPFSNPDIIIIPGSIESWKDSPRLLVPYVSDNYAKTKGQIEVDAEENAFVENDADYTDFALAQHFLNEEKRRKKARQMRVRMFLENLNQYKEIARKILSTKRKIETQMSEAETAKPKTRCYTPKPRTRCETCGKMIITKKLHIHQLMHDGLKSHLCDHCGRAFSLRKYLYRHIKAQHEEVKRRFVCSTCGIAFKRKTALQIHERIHSDERPHVCKYCDKGFRESGALVRHIRTHTGEKPYACNICGTSYAARDTYVQHYRRMHAVMPDGSMSERIYRCDTCGKTFHRLLAYEKHRATHTGGVAAVRCNEPNCTFTYSDIAQLKDHMSSAHPEKTYTCSICSKVFLSKPSLLEHEMRHDPAKHFRCSMCPKTVTTKKSLMDHEKTHTRETPYECSVCDAKFHSPYLLNIHMRKHEPPGRRKRIRKRAENSAESVAE